MRVLVELGWRAGLAPAELAAVAGSEPLAVAWPCAIIEVDDPNRLARLGHAHRVSRFLGVGSVDVLPFNPQDVVVGSYAVRTHGSSMLGAGNRSRLLDMVWFGLDEPDVELDEPDTVLHAHATAAGVWWGVEVLRIDTEAFATQRVRDRPVQVSIGLSQRLGRVVANLAGAAPGVTVVDPCCGAGGLLLEAAAAGARVRGSDLEPRLVHAARRNLAAAGVAGAIEQADLRRLEGTGDLEAIVADLPYGHSAPTHGVEPRRIAAACLSWAAAALRPGGRAALVTRLGDLPHPPPVLEPVAVHAVGAQSLTRQVTVLRRLPLP